MEKILVVDDEAPMLDGLLRVSGFEIVFAENEKQARAVLETQQISIILMDGNLDPGNDLWGRDVVKRLRSSGYTLLICMFSSDKGMNVEGVEAGADSSFKKDWNDDEMSERLGEHLKTLMRGSQ
ncbi:MAG: response regulator [Candidatus Pacebacteria bacterium]|nr:response regulator [Candidatus Paceibacterota bacterium]MCF7857366.1 response regulator [Candidatus Paceibacterota bacterium]